MWQVFLVWGWASALAMVIGSLSYRVPPRGWEPEGTAAEEGEWAEKPLETRQFWLLWVMQLSHTCCGFGAVQLLALVNVRSHPQLFEMDVA